MGAHDRPVDVGAHVFEEGWGVAIAQIGEEGGYGCLGRKCWHLEGSRCNKECFDSFSRLMLACNIRECPEQPLPALGRYIQA